MFDKDKVYSLNGEKYYIPDDFAVMIDGNDDELIEYYEADPVYVRHSDLVNVESLIEDMCSSVYSMSGGDKWDYLNDINADELEELIVRYLEQTVDQPNVFMVENVVFHSVSK